MIAKSCPVSCWATLGLRCPHCETELPATTSLCDLMAGRETCGGCGWKLSAKGEVAAYQPFFTFPAGNKRGAAFRTTIVLESEEP